MSANLSVDKNPDIAAWAEAAWNGALEKTAVSPFATPVGLLQVAPRIGFVAAFANACAVDTDDGLVLVDTSSMFFAQPLFDAVRAFTPRLLHTAIYTHGHVDHVFGLPPFLAEAGAQGRSVRVIAHRACPERFDRYRLTRGYNAVINARQFGFPVPFFPDDFRYPDQTIDREQRLEIGGVTIDLFHDRGETDDHIWAHLPSADALYTGDLFIWASPNCGNPQKVQRYPREWAAALRKMARLDARILMPGHGPPILGRDRVRQALSDTAALLETLVDQTLALLNQGAPLDAVLHGVKMPTELLARPYLRASYDDPRFIVRNLYRLYAGWWDGNVANLLPAPEGQVAGEIAALVGGVEPLLRRAQALQAAGDLAMAGHLIELALRATGPTDPHRDAVRAAYRQINDARAQKEGSLMAQGIFRFAANSQLD